VPATEKVIEAAECVELLRLATPLLFRANLFRVLGLPITATAADVRRNQKRLEMRRKLGMAAAEAAGGALALVPEPDEGEIRTAIARLTDPQARLIDEVFWFWPLTAQGDTESDADAALIALQANRCDEAVEIWKQEAGHHRHGQIAAHNLAVFDHIAALDLEALATSGRIEAAQRDRLPGLWSRVLSRWRDVVEGEQFWSRVLDRVRAIDDVRLTADFVERLRRTLPKALLLINASAAYAAAERGDSTYARRQFLTIHGAGYAAGLADDALREAMKPLRSRIKAAVDQAATRWKNDPVHAEQFVRELLTQSTALLAIVDSVLPDDNAIRTGLHDMVAEALSDGVWAYARKTEDWKRGAELLQMIRGVAAGQILKTKQAKEVETLKENASSGNDWCSPGYWNLPEQTIQQLELIREQAKGGDYDGAIQALAGMDANIGKPLRRCVAYCLCMKGIRIYNDASNETALGGIMQKLRDKLSSGGAMAGLLLRRPDPHLPAFMNPPCPVCGNSGYTQWVNFTFRDLPMFMCSSCSAQHDRETEQDKQRMKGKISESLEYLLLAEELDPGDAGVRRNLETLKKSASGAGCPLPSTKALRQKLSAAAASRSQQDNLETIAEHRLCHFCGHAFPAPACAITLPMCSGGERAAMLFQAGTVYRAGEVTVPRCQSCRDLHAGLAARIEQWHARWRNADAQEHFPELNAAIDAAQQTLRAAERERASSTEPGRFPELAAEFAATVAAADEAARLLETPRRGVADAQAALDRALAVLSAPPRLPALSAEVAAAAAAVQEVRARGDVMKQAFAVATDLAGYTSATLHARAQLFIHQEAAAAATNALRQAEAHEFDPLGLATTLDHLQQKLLPRRYASSARGAAIVAARQKAEERNRMLAEVDNYARLVGIEFDRGRAQLEALLRRTSPKGGWTVDELMIIREETRRGQQSSEAELDPARAAHSAALERLREAERKSIAEAEQRVIQCRAELESASVKLKQCQEETRPARERHEVAKRRLEAAQREAAAAATLVVEQAAAALERARQELRVAREQAAAKYLEQHPRPALPTGVKSEAEYLQFRQIPELLQRGWFFGPLPAKGKSGSATPVDVRGLVAREPSLSVPAQVAAAAGTGARVHPAPPPA
jgi:hypothetical protein